MHCHVHGVFPGKMRNEKQHNDQQQKKKVRNFSRALAIVLSIALVIALAENGKPFSRHHSSSPQIIPRVLRVKQSP